MTTTSLDHEVWVPVKGYEELYSISSQGNIKSVVRSGTKPDGSIKPTLGNWSYLIVRLSRNNKKKLFLFHRLMAAHFIDNPDNLKFVNHINGNKLDNRLQNLEWCTSSYNNKHAYATGLKSYSPLAKDRMIEVWGVKIDVDGQVFMTISEAAIAMGVDRSTTVKKLRKSNGNTFIKGKHWRYCNDNR